MHPCFLNNFSHYLGTATFKESDVETFELNSGSIVAIAGIDFAIVVADARLCTNSGRVLISHDKIFALSPLTVLGSTAPMGDAFLVKRLIESRMQTYEFKNFKTMTTNAAANELSMAMYKCKLVPHGLCNILVGIDKTGEGIVYTYNGIGRCRRQRYTSGGSADAFLRPVLHERIGRLLKFRKHEITKTYALNVALYAFGVANRQTYTGKSIIVNIITKQGIDVQLIELDKA
ncbi:proteasome subunit beta type-1-like [Scaptodrosophila lebanonensis]|uniref:Proteasome subunit beta type-1-like n=1 Tax=Drosophila lebanonensis TaxID=7225 RepID=A0A6J2TYM5_DROLE|nr:proteasome subunit beta type-1-like [Scaptodrosophila lebanonensis]